eukprot:gene10683-12633_t
MDDQDLCIAASVCRQWRELSEDAEFWESLNFEGRNVTQEQVLRLCAKFPDLRHLNVHGLCLTPPFDQKFEQALAKLPRLKDLRMGKQTMSFNVLTRLETYCPLLESLVVTDPVGHIQPGMRLPGEVRITHPQLQVLEISHCRAILTVLNCALLTRVALRHVSAAPITFTCPQLTDLDLSYSK